MREQVQVTITASDVEPADELDIPTTNAGHLNSTGFIIFTLISSLMATYILLNVIGTCR